MTTALKVFVFQSMFDRILDDCKHYIVQNNSKKSNGLNNNDKIYFHFKYYALQFLTKNKY